MNRSFYNRILSVTCALVLGCGLLACAPGDETPPPAAADGDSFESESEMTDNESEAETPAEKPAAWPACTGEAVNQTISFVHVNDLHASYGFNPDERGATSPWAHLRGYFEAVRAENPYTLFSNGGDDHEKGSVVEQLSAGYATTDATVAMGFDVRVIGNHDFAYSREEFLSYTHDPHALVLAANTSFDGPDPSLYGAKNSGILRVGCVTIGFFGLTSDPWNELDESYVGDFYPGSDLHTRHDYAAQAKELVAALRPQVDLVVMVSHLGYGGDQELARDVPGIDLILGGHSHTKLSEPKKVGDTLIIQAGSEGLFVARLDLDLDLASRKVTASRYQLKMNLGEALPLSVETNDELARVLRRYGAEAYQGLGQLQTSQSKSMVPALAARAVREVLPAEAALIEHATVWNGLSDGALFAQDLLDAFKVEREPAGTPGFNSIYTVVLSGAQLALLASAYPKSGWTYQGPESIDAAKTYTLALQKRVAFHPDKYLPGGISLPSPVARGEVWELLARYAAARQAICRYVDSDDKPLLCIAPDSK